VPARRLAASRQYLLHFSLVGTHFLFSVSVRSVIAAVTGLQHGPAARPPECTGGPGGGVTPTPGPGLSFFKLYRGRVRLAGRLRLRLLANLSASGRGALPVTRPAP
jgi:hypothetical protein